MVAGARRQWASGLSFIFVYTALTLVLLQR